MKDAEPKRAATSMGGARRAHRPGVTVLPSAEGPGLRSDPRWTAEGARRTMALLDRLVARRRPARPG